MAFSNLNFAPQLSEFPFWPKSQFSYLHFNTQNFALWPLFLKIFPLKLLGNLLIYSSKIEGFHILPSLKKFHPQNLECSTSLNPTNRDAPLLKISPHASQYQLSLMSIKSPHVPEYFTNYKLKSQVHDSPRRSSQSSSNLWLSLALLNEYNPFCYIFYDYGKRFESLMIKVMVPWRPTDYQVTFRDTQGSESLFGNLTGY